MSAAPPNQPPNLSAHAQWRWRVNSCVIMSLTCVVSKAFLYGLNKVEVYGLPRFLELLDQRRDPEKRQRGLITVSNHISVIDDPLIWGVLPLSYIFDPRNLRWGLGAHDICHTNGASLLSAFFTFGQVLPTHRLKHSGHGGLFQSTFTEALRLLSSRPSASFFSNTASPPAGPFAASTLTYNSPFYTTTGQDWFPRPSFFAGNRLAWVHIYPEGLVHQHPAVDLRYFKWGAARLILEADPAPDMVPMFIDGTQRILAEDRGFPRFVPRIGQRVRVAFGERVDFDKTFGDLRKRWRELVHRETGTGTLVPMSKPLGGELALPETLKYGEEASAIRIEAARRIREEVLKVRRSLGYPESDERFALAETWAQNPGEKSGSKRH